jgi:lipid-binding SYLF domain-containing protein
VALHLRHFLLAGGAERQLELRPAPGLGKEMTMAPVSRAVLFATALAVMAPMPARLAAQDRTDEVKTIEDSVVVLQTLTSSPDDRIPDNLLRKAEAIVVIPSLIKGGFVIGAKHGKGVISVRDSATGRWSVPAFVTMTGGSIGWQIGVESVDLVLLVMNRDGVDKLLDDKFTIGGSLSAAAGPVGRSGDAATDAQVSAEILAYSRAKGLFAGATFEGSALHADDSDNADFYGPRSNLRELVLAPGSRTTVPPPAATWQETLQRLAGRTV